MSDSAAARRIRAVLEMYEFGEQVYRARLRRERPDATAAEIEERVREWRLERLGAPMGDAVVGCLRNSDEPVGGGASARC